MVLIPYKIQRKGKQYCVVKEDSGASVGCHPSQAEAMKHMKALYAKVPDAKKYSVDDLTLQLGEIITAALPEVPSNAAPIRLYFQEGEKTPDGRIIDPNAVNFDRSPPFPIRLQTRAPEGGGHAGAEVCGVINAIARDGLTIICDGHLDLNQVAGQQAYGLIYARTMQTWSPDMGDAVVDVEGGYDLPSPQGGPGEIAHVVSATFLGATLVALPALASAVVELLNEDGSILISAPHRNSQSLTISACAGPVAPPAAFFAKQDLPELQRWVAVTADGHVYGHSAGRGECHIGYFDKCVTIDMIADVSGGPDAFGYAMPGHVIAADGSKIPTGPLPIKGGHAGRGLDWKNALSHYDDPSAAVADVCYYVDSFGIQFSGALRPDATEAQIHALRASGVSLDAREIDGQLRYLATCCVNTPGFPKMAIRASGDDILTLVAAGGPPQAATDDCGCGNSTGDDMEDETRELMDRIEALTTKVDEMTTMFEEEFATIKIPDGAMRIGGWRWSDGEKAHAASVVLPKILSGWRWSSDTEAMSSLTKLLGGWRWSTGDSRQEAAASLGKLLGGWRWAAGEEASIASKLLSGWRWSTKGD